jgi:hypothetical protein
MAVTNRQSDIITVLRLASSRTVGDTLLSAGYYLAALDTAKHTKWVMDISSMYRSQIPTAEIRGICLDSSDAIYLLGFFSDSVYTYNSTQYKGKLGWLNDVLLKVVNKQVIWSQQLPGVAADGLIESFRSHGLNQREPIECGRSDDIYIVKRAYDSVRVSGKLYSEPHKDIVLLLHYGSNGSLRAHRRLGAFDTLSACCAPPQMVGLTAPPTGGCIVRIGTADSNAIDTAYNSGLLSNSLTLLSYNSLDRLRWIKHSDSGFFNAPPDTLGDYLTSDRFGNTYTYLPPMNPFNPPQKYEGLTMGGLTKGGAVIKIDSAGRTVTASYAPFAAGYGRALGMGGRPMRLDRSGNIYYISEPDAQFAQDSRIRNRNWCIVRLTPSLRVDWVYSDTNVLRYSIFPGTTTNCYVDGTSNISVLEHVKAVTFVVVSSRPTTVCRGSRFSIPYSLSSALYSNNSFTAELSDVAGSFNRAITLGLLRSSVDSQVNCTLPDSIAAGNGYRIRIVSSNPILITPSVPLTILPLPVVHILHPKGLTICQGDEAALIASGASKYLWSTGDTTRVLYIRTAGKYVLSGIDTNGCSNVDSVRVTVNSLPRVTLSALGRLSFCEGDSVRLQANGAKTYTWSTGDTGKVIAVRSAGVYRVFGRDTNLCQAVSDSVVVTVYANPPKPAITREGDELVSSSDTANQWYYKGIKMSGATSKRFPLSAEGAYSVSVTNEHGCSSISDSYIYSKTGDVALPSNTSWSVSLTPGSCSITNASGDTFHVEVLDILGREVSAPTTLRIESAANVPLSSLHGGTYFIRVSTAGRVQTLKYIAR